MKRPLAGFVLVGFVLGWGAGGEARGESWADGLISESGHDFGPVARGATVRHNFVLTNRLAEPITILGIRASCGCTTGRAAASTVAPGQSTVIEAEMDTRNFSGPKSTALFVTVVGAGGREAEVRLAVASNILSDIVLNPGTIDFGAVARGEPARESLTIERIGAPDWRVERMLSACRAIDANMVETSRSGSAVVYTLTVALKPDTPPGLIRDEIRVLTNDPESPAIPVLVTGQVRGELSATPSVLALGKVASAAGARGRFLLRASRPFSIVGVEGAGDGFQVEPADPSARPIHVLTVAFRPEEATDRGDLRRTFRVLTDLPGEPPLDLTVTLHVDP